MGVFAGDLGTVLASSPPNGRKEGLMFRTSFKRATILLLCLTGVLIGTQSYCVAQEDQGAQAQPEAPKDMPCPDCHGKGGTKANCKDCNGSGMCQSCMGKGERATAASKTPVTCLKCKGSGLCKICNGSGGPTTKCAQCGGTGKISRAQSETSSGDAEQPAAQQPDSQSPEGSSEAETPAPREEHPPRPPRFNADGSPRERPPHSPGPRSGGDSMSSYMDIMHRLQQQYDNRRFKAAELKDVLSASDSHIGELLQSDVYVLGGNPRGVVAGTSEYPSNKEMVKLTPVSREVGNVIWVFMEKATGVRKARIVYGIQSADNFVLFNIAEPSAASK
jgi:hypothetical protein